MNQFRQSLEELFKEAEMDQKIKDVEEYYNKGVEDSRNNSIMNKLNELMGIRSAYANDTIPYIPTDYSKYGPGFTREEIDQMNNDRAFHNDMRRVYGNEGGYTNQNTDLGGPTNMGISTKTFSKENVAGMSKERADMLYHKNYWAHNGINHLPEDLRSQVLDAAVLFGEQTAITALHRSLGINPTGDIIGKTTLNRLEEQNHEEVLNRFVKNLEDKIDKIIERNPEQIVYKKGWLNRIHRY